jgi:hypothetical protein
LNAIQFFHHSAYFPNLHKILDTPGFLAYLPSQGYPKNISSSEEKWWNFGGTEN